MSGYIKRGGWVVAVLLGWMAMGVSAQGASFDCAKAGTKVEHIICDDAEISRLDDELNESYKAALKDKSQAAAIKKAQKLWMKGRNGCIDAVCVQKAYQKRIGQLKTTAAQTQSVQVVTQLSQSESEPEAVCLAPKIDWRNYEWTIISGKGESICEEMLAYVKSRPKNAPPPVCPDERLPSNGNWTRPESRILSEDERQALIRDIPEQWQQKPNGPVSYERKFREAKLMREIRADITRDGIPERLLAYSQHDYRQTCERATRCARDDDTFHREIVIGWGESDFYDLLPMSDVGTQVNWKHPSVGASPMLMNGELSYYKSVPYWMSFVSWHQGLHENFARSSMRPDDPYSAIFELNSVSTYSSAIPQSKAFKDVTNVSPKIADPEDINICRFGYFHHNNLKLNSPKGRK